MTRVQRWWAVAAILAGALFACTLGMMATAFAAPPDQPALVYDGASKTFSYRNVEGSDLFASFKNLVPGDRLSQRFAVQAEHLEHPTTLYMRAEYDAGERAGLEPIELAVSVNGADLGNGSVSDEHGLDRDTKLASLDRDGSLDAEVDISVPTSVGNELADSAHELHWVFTAQEEGEASGSADRETNSSGDTVATTTSDAIARTGDAAPLALMAAVAVAALALFIFAVRKARRP